ncbi:MAG: hypothetical protein ACOX5W_13250 [Bacillota bacterium]|jgi:chromosome segregation ATPase
MIKLKVGEDVDDRLDQVFKMVTELIHITGNTNSIVEELRAEVTELRAEVTELRAEVTELRAEVTDLKAEVNQLTIGQDNIKARLERMEADVREIKESRFSIYELLGEHDLAIRTLRKKTDHFSLVDG